VQPVEADFFDFDPAVADRRLFALLESLAATRRVEAGEAAVRAIEAEQR
jgi:hypothetical protein